MELNYMNRGEEGDRAALPYYLEEKCKPKLS